MGLLISLAGLLPLASAFNLQSLPPVDWVSTGNDHFTFSQHTPLYISASSARNRDVDGLTLIPPTALDFAQTFSEDLSASFRGKEFTVEQVRDCPKRGIYLSLLSNSERKTYTYQSGELTSEGYELVVTKNLVEIHGSGSRGIWWGTRTLLQQLALHNGKIPEGRTRDAPAYETRGYMLDAGRKWYSPEFLKELCTYASFFKLNEFHYHTSDNYPLTRGHNETWQDVYSQFSLRPKSPALRGLIQRRNETLSRKDFESLQSHCASRGVTIIPEIEAPGHALSITKWKPQIALMKKDLLNLTHPETLPTMKSIWTEFLPWFKAKHVHIGADEYDPALADDYVRFVNAMSAFLSSYGKKTRIWGTFEPSKIPIDKSVIVQHWQYGQSDPVQLVSRGYEVINSEDWWNYISIKNNHSPVLPAPYPQSLNISHTLNFGDKEGYQWEPKDYNPVNITSQLRPDEKGNKGAVMASWNDNGPAASTQLEAYYAWRDGFPVVAARMWAGSRGPRLNVATLSKSVGALAAKAPSQNLDRVVETPFIWRPSCGEKVGRGSKGPEYTLELKYDGPFTLSSSDVALELEESGVLKAVADGYEYPLRSVSARDAETGRIWTNATSSSHEPVKLRRKGEITLKTDVKRGTRVWEAGRLVGRFEVFVFGGRNVLLSWSQMAFVAPLEEVRGGLKELRLGDGC